MSDTAVRLEQVVLPEVPVRHWVCTFPWGVRIVLGYDRDLCRAAVVAFAKELSRSLKHRAKALLGLSSVDHALTGSVAVVQHTDGALRLNTHLHVLGLDGVYVEDEQHELRFYALGTPSAAAVADIARRTALRLHRAFQKKGRPSPWDDEHAFTDSGEADPFSIEQPGLFACYQAAASGVAVSAERAGQVSTVCSHARARGKARELGGAQATAHAQPCPMPACANSLARCQLRGQHLRASLKILRWTLLGLGVLALVATLLPFIPSNASAVRVWDFPRLQVAVVLAVVLVGALVLLPRREVWTWAFAASLATGLVWQAHWIWPYSPLASTEAREAGSCEAGSRVTLVVANVLIENRDAAPLLALVERTGPDMVLLVETDAWWDEQLSPLKKAYAHVVAQPQEDSYGIHLFSRLPLIEPEVRFLIQDYVPSIKTGVMLRSGARINLYGLHPMPPPHQDTERRDAELLVAGKEVHREPVPAILAGDLNDVAWSRSNNLFQQVSGLLDPRIGRGVYATFSADWPLLRFPLDYVFFERSFQLLELEVLEHIGSDHFPLFIALCYRPDSAAATQSPPPEGSAVEKANEAIQEGREEAAED